MSKVKISNLELKVFRQLQKSSFELGGKIILNGEGVERTEMVNGSRRNVLVSQFPIGQIWFHTHPSIPLVKIGETMFGRVLKDLVKTKDKDFSVDIIVQPVSDDDLLAMTESIQEEKTCVMMVFSPEGIYVMEKGFSLRSARKTPSFSLTALAKGVLPSESTISRISRMIVPRKELMKRAREYLRMRDELVLSHQETLIRSLRKMVSEKSKKELLAKFQKQMGRKVSKLIGEVYPEISVKYYPWTTRTIELDLGSCPVQK